MTCAPEDRGSSISLPTSRPRDVGELMRRRFIALSPSDSLLEAGRLMGFARVRQLPVVKDGRLVGILSQRDVLMRSLQEVLASGVEEARRVLRLVSVAALVGTGAPTLPPEASLREAAQSLVSEDRGFVAVVDGDPQHPHLLGLVTESDLLRAVLLDGL